MLCSPEHWASRSVYTEQWQTLYKCPSRMFGMFEAAEVPVLNTANPPLLAEANVAQWLVCCFPEAKAVGSSPTVGYKKLVVSQVVTFYEE